MVRGVHPVTISALRPLMASPVNVSSLIRHLLQTAVANRLRRHRHHGEEDPTPSPADQREDRALPPDPPRGMGLHPTLDLRSPTAKGVDQQVAKAVGTTVASKRLAHGGDQKGQGRDPLLTVDEHDALAPLGGDRRQDRTDEVRPMRNAGGPDIAEQTTTPLDVPSVVTLEDRDRNLALAAQPLSGPLRCRHHARRRRVPVRGHVTEHRPGPSSMSTGGRRGTAQDPTSLPAAHREPTWSRSC